MAVSSLVAALCSLLQVSAQDIVAEPIQISAVASSNQTVDFPRVHGQNGDLLTVSLSDSCSLLKYGQLPVEQLPVEQKACQTFLMHWMYATRSTALARTV